MMMTDGAADRGACGAWKTVQIGCGRTTRPRGVGRTALGASRRSNARGGA